MTVNKIFTDIFFASMCISAIGYLCQAYGVFPVNFGITDLSQWQNWFTIDLVTGVIGGVAGGVGVLALLLKQGTFAVYALLVGVILALITPVRGTITFIPSLIASLLVDSALAAPIIIVIQMITVVAAGWFIITLVLQRPLE